MRNGNQTLTTIVTSTTTTMTSATTTATMTTTMTTRMSISDANPNQMLFGSILVQISYFSEIQLVCDGPTDEQTHPPIEMRERI